MSVPSKELYQAISASLVQAIKSRIGAYNVINKREPDESDGSVCDPTCHHVLFEDEEVRIINVIDSKGKKGNSHTHARAAVMYVDMPAKIIYRDDVAGTEEMILSEEERFAYIPQEEHHTIENIDTKDFCAFRIEFKKDIASFEEIQTDLKKILLDCLCKHKEDLKNTRVQLLRQEYKEKVEVKEREKAPEPILLLKTATEQVQVKSSQSLEDLTPAVDIQMNIVSSADGSAAKVKV